MRLPSQPQAHWTYCTNIHPGESWAEVRRAVLERVPAVRGALGRSSEPFGVGLRLSARAAAELLADPAALPTFARELAERGLYVFTINGFPYGPFHGRAVKQAVYRPDWREPARARYTAQLAAILGALLPPGVEGSISTVPGGFRPETRGAQARAEVVAGLLSAAADLWRRRQAGGPHITLALEPEPCCMFETTAELVAFLRDELLARTARARFAAMTGLSRAAAGEALRAHVGVCFDACHAAVEFEDPRASIRAITDAGLRLAKVQISAALVLDPVDDAGVEALEAFADPVYLHQVVARDRDDQLHRFLDIHDAVRSRAAGEHAPAQWRAHVHVPIFEAGFGPLGSTAASLPEVIDCALERGGCRHFEVETYTWEVLPPRLRALPLDQSIARELEHALALAQPRTHSPNTARAGAPTP